MKVAPWELAERWAGWTSYAGAIMEAEGIVNSKETKTKKVR